MNWPEIARRRVDDLQDLGCRCLLLQPPARFGHQSRAFNRDDGLVSEGLTNSMIAAQLVVSRRTVDSQVLAAYRKLGVSSRVALTRALIENT